MPRARKNDKAAEGVKFDAAASRGLFVGIAQFDDPQLTPVPYAVDDAVDLAAYFCFELGLLRPIRCVLALAGEPIKLESKAALARLQSEQARTIAPQRLHIIQEVRKAAQDTGADGILLLGYASHGLFERGLDHVLAQDSWIAHLAQTTIALSDIFDEVSYAKTQRRVVLLDTCRGRYDRHARAAGLEAPPQEYFDAVRKARGQIVMHGTTTGGSTYDDPALQNGVFTHALLAGLRGAADPGPAGFITAQTLGDYVDGEIQRWVKLNRQHQVALTLGSTLHAEPASAASALPLAPHPGFQHQSYRQRKAAAVKKLAKLQVGEGPITGQVVDEVRSFLDAHKATDAIAVQWLDNVDALDTKSLTQEGFLHAWRQMQVSRRVAEPSNGRWLNRLRKAYLLVAASMLAYVGVSASMVVYEKMRPTSAPQELYVENAAPQKAPETIVTSPLLVEQKTASGKIHLGLESPAPRPPAEAVTRAGKAYAGQLAVDRFGLRWRYVPPGSFERFDDQDEAPAEAATLRQKVTLTPGYWMGETELTQAQWMKLVPRHDSNQRGDDFPITNVSFYDAMDYANQLSKLAGRQECYELSCSGTRGTEDFRCKAFNRKKSCDGYRLPLEAEWEWAARGANPKPPVESLDEVAWYQANGEGILHAVKTRRGNALDLHDMQGNIREWVWDAFAAYGTAPVVDPSGSNRAERRVARGGSWGSAADEVAVTRRDHYRPTQRGYYLGFRLCTSKKPD